MRMKKHLYAHPNLQLHARFEKAGKDDNEFICGFFTPSLSVTIPVDACIPLRKACDIVTNKNEMLIVNTTDEAAANGLMIIPKLILPGQESPMEFLIRNIGEAQVTLEKEDRFAQVVSLTKPSKPEKEETA